MGDPIRNSATTHPRTSFAEKFTEAICILQVYARDLQRHQLGSLEALVSLFFDFSSILQPCLIVDSAFTDAS